MKIVSKFKDYYDYMAYLGVDPKIVYARHTTVLKHNEYKPIPFSLGKFSTYHLPGFDTQTRDDKHGFVPVHLGHFDLIFCGQCYTGWVYTIGYSNGSVEYIWSVDRLKEIYLEFLQRTYMGRRLYTHNFAEGAPEWNELEQWVVRPANPAILNEYPDIPVIVSSGYSIVLNPKLDEYEFYNKVEAEQAWQQLSMWLSREPDVPETVRTEKLNLQRHGMDSTSFKRSDHPAKPRGKK